MESNHNELEREERKLRRVGWYQILMTFFLVLALLAIALWATTAARLRAQERLRGDFDHVSLIIKVTQGQDSKQSKEIIAEEEVFTLYDGPYISKDYYGQTLESLLMDYSAHFIIEGGMLRGVNHGGNSYYGWWLIYSYSERNVDADSAVQVGLNQLLLDRVNIFTFQLRNQVELE